MKIQELAFVCWAANTAYEIQHGVKGSFAPPSLEDCANVIDGVEFILKNPSVTPEQLHNHWQDKKLREGWVCGPNKDKKENPYLIPWVNLTEVQKHKDYLFLGIVDALKELLDE